MHPGPRARLELSAVTFRPPKGTGMLTGAALIAWSLALAVAAIGAVWGGGTGFTALLGWLAAITGILLAALFALWLYGLATLSYVVAPDVVLIRWGFRRIVIPIDTILRMVPGRTMDKPRVEGLRWLGYHLGHADIHRLGYTIFFATRASPDELLYIHTTQESYALTVLDQARFAEEVQARAALGPLQSREQRSRATGLAAIPIWRDRVAIGGALLAVGSCVLLCSVFFLRYDGLPSIIAIKFPVSGDVVRVGDKEKLLGIPWLSVGILATNLLVGVLVHVRERAAAVWLFTSSAMLQILLLGAALVAFQSA
ncbi:MAG: PH domain-containing protein [Dehalococcoidia bacterium]